MPLAKVYVDLGLRLEHGLSDATGNEQTELWQEAINRARKIGNPDSLKTDAEVIASSATLLEPSKISMLLAGPGCGKSTITQYLALYHAAAILNHSILNQLTSRLRLPELVTTDDIQTHVKLRIPFKIDLRRFAKWQSQ